MAGAPDGRRTAPAAFDLIGLTTRSLNRGSCCDEIGSGHDLISLFEHDLLETTVMPGLVPGHPRLSFLTAKEDVDGRDKPGHDESDSFSSCIESLRPVGAATAVWSEIPSARTGVRRRIGVVAPAPAIGSAMPARAASAGDFDDIGARCRHQCSPWHRVGGTSGHQRAGQESGCDQSVHELLP
jgi:hypothetical protein